MKYWIALIALLFFAACGGKDTVASRSAAAFREAQQKGTPVGTDGHGDHQHPGPGTPAADSTADRSTMTGMDRSTMTGMDHSTMTGMDHSTMTGGASMAGMDHSGMQHGVASTPGMDHSNMQHGVASTSGMDHSNMQHGVASTSGMDHSRMQHGAPSTSGMDHSRMQHGVAARPGMDHSRTHSSEQSTMAAPDHSSMPGMQHGAAAVPASAPPTTAAGLDRLRPASTLTIDAFDAPSPTAVSEAAKAAHGGGHDGTQMRGITPGQDRENPPTPAPAFRDGPAGARAVDHSQHGQTAPGELTKKTATPQASPAAPVYTCPMHPEITSDKPGTCPKCGMALVRK